MTTVETLPTRSAGSLASPGTATVRPRRRRAPATRLLKAGLGLLLAALVWSLLATFAGYPRSLFPSIPDIVGAGRDLAQQGYLLPDTLASGQRALIGFLLGSIVGLTLAVVTSQTATGRALMEPILRLFAPVPTIGLVPLAILWFGIGEGSKLTVVALGVFVPVWINSHAGLSTTPADFIKVARCLGSSRRQTLLRVVLPEAAPDMAAGLRVGAAMSFVLIVVAEMTGTTNGLGYRIYQAQMFSQADQLMVCLVVLGLMGAAFDQLIAWGTAPCTRWAAEER